ncbi:acetyl-CoA carboxylase carboxyltransferase subunit alpha [Haliovirga abyssi]|uniref:acetyl-CoA carboxylase carboxyltransferase subunit alpha n=1 Tax=Haliovirga abyssi TaxID=2996794 RepID=UPI0027DD09BD|nr:acetyl-CoA carboxylase carboxyltransferase subunit alpha [Haliovirga abyssi]
MSFENEIKELESKIKEIQNFSKEKGIDLSLEIEKMENEINSKLKDIYSNLTPWQKNMVSRHPQRPYTLDYIEKMVTDFQELHGDRLFRDDPALVCGIGKIGEQAFMIIGHQRGRDVKENLYRNFGMANPEGYRKALRVMKMAERFKLPVLTLIDTAGAYPGLEAEEHGQGEAIARNLLEMAGLKTQIISVIIGEGGSGGALALGVGDRVLMLSNSTYSVISPEGCAAILFKDSSKAETAAIALKIDSENLENIGIIDGIIEEPIGGAHRDYDATSKALKNKILDTLKELKQLSIEELKDARYKKYRSYGEYKEI